MQFLIFAVVVALAAARMTEQEYLYQFQVYKKAQGKAYLAHEVAARYAAFKSNFDFVETHNARFAAGEETYDVEMNEFADLTIQEFSKIYLRPFNSTRAKNVVILPEVNSVAGSVDWRTKGAVTPVKNQGQCGSCWAFSTTGSVEGAVQIATGTLTSVSEQQLVDCSSAEGNQGCNGGLMDQAFQYIIKNGGIDTEADYGYTARDGACNKAKAETKASKITGFKDVAHNQESQLIAAVTQQPVSVAIEADQSGFQLYKSGVFSGPCGTQLDHGVLAVGYGSTPSNYWIVKNSWGASWGNQGYIWMAQGKGNAGICGINMEPSYPTASASEELVTPNADPHYAAPPCLADETQVTITGISGTFCSPACSARKPCPTDVPAGTTAQPECVLEAQGHSQPTNCALICNPSTGGCPTGATCQPIQGTGVCTFPQ